MLPSAPSDKQACVKRPARTPAVAANQAFSPPTGPSLFQEVDIDSPLGAAAMMQSARARLACRAYVAKDGRSVVVERLAFPLIDPSQVVARQLFAGGTVEDEIVLRVNDRAILIVAFALGGGRVPDSTASESFTRRAYARARDVLGS